jgi:hypothetical protein
MTECLFFRIVLTRSTTPIQKRWYFSLTMDSRRWVSRSLLTSLGFQLALCSLLSTASFYFAIKAFILSQSCIFLLAFFLFLLQICRKFAYQLLLTLNLIGKRGGPNKFTIDIEREGNTLINGIQTMYASS